MKRLVLALALALPACGLHPLYQGGASGPVARGLAGIAIAPIEGKSGYLMSNALRDRLPDNGGGAPRYRLEVRLSDDITGLGITRDNRVTRERRTLRARYQLVDAQTGETMLDATAGSDSGIDVVDSEYATIAAENAAIERLSDIVADQIVTRIALFTRRNSPK